MVLSEPEITVNVFGWNEVETTARTLDEIRDVLIELKVDFEILFIDDGSTDGTSEAADAYATKEPRVRVIRHGENKGVGPVYRTGFQEARGRFVTFFPADGQFPADIIAKFHPLMDGKDMVLGYIPHRKGSIVGPILSRLERVLYRLFFGPIPRFQGILMFRRKLLDGMNLRSEGRGWAVLMEFIMRATRAKVRMVSIPTTMRARTAGVSKVNNLANIKANLTQVIKLRGLMD